MCCAKSRSIASVRESALANRSVQPNASNGLNLRAKNTVVNHCGNTPTDPKCAIGDVVVVDAFFSHPALDFHMRGHNFGNADGEYYWMCHDQVYSSKTHYTSNLLLEIATDFGTYNCCTRDADPGNCDGGTGRVGFLAIYNTKAGDCGMEQPYWASLGTAEECKHGETPQLGVGKCKWRVVQRLKTVEHHNCLYNQQHINDQCTKYCPKGSICNGTPLKQAFEKCPDVGGGARPGNGQPILWNNGKANKCLDPWDFKDGAKAEIWSCDKQQKQEWFLMFKHTGSCQVVNALAPEWCLTISGGVHKAALATLSKCGANGWEGQTFDCGKWGQTGMLPNMQNSKQCLTVPGGDDTDGTQLFLWDCDQSDVNQQWTFKTSSNSVAATSTNATTSASSSILIV